MKKLLIALIALVSISLSVNAQTTSHQNVRQHPTERKHNKHHRHRKFKRHRHHRHHRMAQVNFSDAQKAEA